MGYYSEDGRTRPDTKIRRIAQLKEVAHEVADHYLKHGPTQYGVRISNCALYLEEYPGLKYGHFIDTWHCKHRHCPLCQWSKSRRWRAQTQQVLETYPARLEGKWLYLTLTVRNCHVTELGDQLKHMNAAFRRMTRSSSWQKYVRGGIRFVEVDQGSSDAETAHPHYHCLLYVKPSMYEGNNYRSEAKWAEIWQKCLNESYTPQVNCSRLKGEGEDLQNAILQKVSYSMKPREHAPPGAWFIEMTEQMRGVQLVTPFGELRGWFKQLNKEGDSEIRKERKEIRESHCPRRFRWECNTSRQKQAAVAGAECNTVIELKPEHHAASPWHF
ncbi:protein rep, partial [Pseudomonas sp. NP21570]|nr:protein rep [Pseudomonas sp. NP21570]